MGSILTELFQHIAFVLDAMIYLLKQDFATTLFESSNSKDTIKDRLHSALETTVGYAYIPPV